MTVTSIAFVPSAPLLVPAVAGGSAGVDDGLRAVSVDVVARAIDDAPGGAVVVASTASAGEWAADAMWSFSGFGVERVPPDASPALPWPLGIGAWLLDECGWTGPRRYLGLGPHDGAADVGSVASTSAIIAVGDGSARRSERAPGHLDSRAEEFDDRVAACLATGDVAGLGALDDALARELWCEAVPVWRWVAASLGTVTVTNAELVSHTAPYGVGYFVALWSLG